MPDRDVVTVKLAVVERCLARIADVNGGQGKQHLRPLDIEDIAAINLQRAIQAAIDLALHIVASEGYGIPESTADSFTLLERQGIMDSDLAGRLRRMVGFRNISIHDYQSVNPDIMEAILDRHLGDLRAFGECIVDAFRLRGAGD